MKGCMTREPPALLPHDVSYVTASSTGGRSLEVLMGAGRGAHSGTRAGMSHPGVMWAWSVATPGSSINTTRLSAHPNGKRHFRRGVNAGHMTSIPSIEHSSIPPRPAGNDRANGRSLSSNDLLALKARL